MNCLEKRQIFRAGLAAHLVRLGFELNLLPFGEIGEARTLDRADVNEHIVAAVLRGDKSKTLLAVKPLHCTLSHVSHLSNRRANARSRTMREASNFSIVFGKGAWRRVNKRRASNRIWRIHSTARAKAQGFNCGHWGAVCRAP